ncbi:MAG: hypothetical protein ACI4WU_02255 [Bacilli bacterium]
MKRILKLIIIAVILLIPIGSVSALTVSENDIKIPASGSKSIELSTSSEELLTSVEFTLVYTTYDIPANFIVNSNYTDSNPNGIKHKVIFPEPISGKITLGNVNINVVNNPKDTAGTINIHSAIGYTETGETITLNAQNINIIIGEESNINTDKPSNDDNSNSNTNKNVLKEIKSDIVKINLQEDVFEYQITIDKEIEKLDLEPIATIDTYKVEVSNQEIATLEDNKINITVTDNTGNKTIYTIKVNILKDVSSVEIDNNSFKEKNTYKGKWIILIIFFSVILLFGLALTKKKK